MKILIVGDDVEELKIHLPNQLTEFDTIEYFTLPTDQTQFDLVVGSNCVRVFPTTISFLKPFVNKVAKLPKSSKPKKTKKKKEEATTTAATETTPVTVEKVVEAVKIIADELEGEK